MSRRPLLLTLCLWAAVPGSARAEDLTSEQIARIRRDEQAALARVNEAHGNKKSSELSNAERKQIILEQRAASQKVMDAHGVSGKDYARQTARMSPTQNAEVAAAQKGLEAREKVPAGPGKSPDAEDISVQHGFNEDNPVTMEEQEGAPPSVEHGLPADEQAPAEAEAAPTEAAPTEAAPIIEEPPAAAAPKPARGGHKKR